VLHVPFAWRPTGFWVQAPSEKVITMASHVGLTATPHVHGEQDALSLIPWKTTVCLGNDDGQLVGPFW
jgi:hypothetical protein